MIEIAAAAIRRDLRLSLRTISSPAARKRISQAAKQR